LTSDDDDELRRRLYILGSDTRWEITSAYSHLLKIGYLYFQDSSGSGHGCSAALVASNVIMTAGHCIHEGNGGNWCSNFKFYPGKTSSTSWTPVYYGYSWMSFTGWTEDGDTDWDIGLIKLSSSPNRGFINFGYDTSIDEDWYLYCVGYPGDKTSGTMWATSDSVYDTYTNILQTDDSDTVDGQSGSPCYSYKKSSYPIMFAVHSGGNKYWSWFSYNYYNRHTRITSSKYSSFCTWINDDSLC